MKRTNQWPRPLPSTNPKYFPSIERFHCPPTWRTRWRRPFDCAGAWWCVKLWWWVQSELAICRGKGTVSSVCGGGFGWTPDSPHSWVSSACKNVLNQLKTMHKAHNRLLAVSFNGFIEEAVLDNRPLCVQTSLCLQVKAFVCLSLTLKMSGEWGPLISYYYLVTVPGEGWALIGRSWHVVVTDGTVSRGNKVQLCLIWWAYPQGIQGWFRENTATQAGKSYLKQCAWCWNHPLNDTQEAFIASELAVALRGRPMDVLWEAIGQKDAIFSLCHSQTNRRAHVLFA